MSDHAILAPSAAHIWVKCAGYPIMALSYPEDETQESREGTAAHWVGYELFHNRPVCVGQVTPNGEVVTQEMIEGAELYVEQLRLVQIFGVELNLERRIDISYINAHNWGTPDADGFNEQALVLHVFDYKFGHRYVDVFENWQLIDYTAGLLDELFKKYTNLDDQSIRVQMTVVQPRSYHKDGPVRTWSTVASELRPYFNKLSNAAALALSDNPPCVPNDNCEFCPARHACTALQASGYRAADHAGVSVPLELSVDAMGLEASILRHAKTRIEARLTGLEQQIESTIRSGRNVPGYALEPSYGREGWKTHEGEIGALGDLFGIDLRKVDVITPKQAIKKGLPAEIVAQYAATPISGQKLIVDDGKLARRVFSK